MATQPVRPLEPRSDRKVDKRSAPARVVSDGAVDKANLVRPYSVDGRTMRFADNP
jgi:hypothetical protein